MSRETAIEVVARVLRPNLFDHTWSSATDQREAQAYACADAKEIVDAAIPHLAHPRPILLDLGGAEVSLVEIRVSDVILYNVRVVADPNKPRISLVSIEDQQ